MNVDSHLSGTDPPAADEGNEMNINSDSSSPKSPQSSQDQLEAIDRELFDLAAIDVANLSLPKNFEIYDSSLPCELDSISQINFPFLDDKLTPYDFDYYNKLPKRDFPSLNGSQVDGRLKRCAIKCQSSFGCESELVFQYSVFEPISKSNKNSISFEFFGHSKARFWNVAFINSAKAAVFVRNNSQAVFDHCLFFKNAMSCFVFSNSQVTFSNCVFQDEMSTAVFVSQFSHAIFENCYFSNIQNKVIYMKMNSIVKITKAVFSYCPRGIIFVMEQSRLYVDSAKFQKSGNSAIRIKQSNIECQNSIIEDIEGNGINFEHSSGYLYNVTIRNTLHPSILARGHKCNPYIYQCTLSNPRDHYMISCRSLSRPIFDQCIFSDVNNYCFMISDYSCPQISNCIFGKCIAKEIFNIINRSYPSIFNNIYGYSNDKIIIRLSKSSKWNPAPHLTSCDEQSGEPKGPIIRQLTTYKKFDPPTHLDCPIELLSNNNRDPESPLKLKTLPTIDPANPEAVFGNEQNVHDESNHHSCNICGTPLDNENLQAFGPCGHIVCEKCGPQFEPDNDKYKYCPVCNSPIADVKKVFYHKECVVCLEKKPDTLCLPCGHMCMCFSCVSKCLERSSNCPMCNTDILAYKIIIDDLEFETITKEQVQNITPV